MNQYIEIQVNANTSTTIKAKKAHLQFSTKGVLLFSFFFNRPFL